jgi:mannose-6-phosphate isomerase class I
VTYDASPTYPVLGAAVEEGFEPLAAAARGRGVLALDGPAALAWEPFVAALRAAIEAAGSTTTAVDVRRSHPPWSEVERRTASAVLPGDPVFGRVFDGSLADLFDGLPRVDRPGRGIALVYGPGAALAPHDELWLVDRPKRDALAAVRAGTAGNVAAPPGLSGTEQRLLFVDWPLLDRHRGALVPRLDRFVDASDGARPRSIPGGTLRGSLCALAKRPFRTRPAFLPGAWGGRWLQRRLGVGEAEPNLAWSYELITPESGVLLDSLEVPFDLLMAQEGATVMGNELARRFGCSFPIRFDYLDTVEGGHLSVQCHPFQSYMREVFGLPYTQHESYYVMATTPGARVFLGLREGADLPSFRADAERAAGAGEPFDPTEYVQSHESTEHRLFLIPAGTVHASGAGNLVLEISATPYLYTLRFYDWLRRDLDGDLRPVHLEHAFANLDPRRAGRAVRRELMREPVLVRGGDGGAELRLGTLPDVPVAVHRLDFADAFADHTGGRFHVLNLVAGGEIEVETAGGHVHGLSYAETIVIPAAVGAYRLVRRRGPAAKVIKAFVP